VTARLALAVACGVVSALPLAVRAADGGAIVAARTSRHVRLDGRLEDDAWREAPAFSAFVESFPRPGVPGNPRTEVRILYDDETIFVGVTCFDPDPSQIVRQLARRDGNPTSDLVEVALDTGSGGRTAYDFSVNAAGVLRDQLLFSDVSATDSWDAVWDAAVSVGDEGWSAELAIPFRQLRFSGGDAPRWRVLVRRQIPRTHQVLDSVLVPREANPVTIGGLAVSRFGPLEGLTELEPRRGFELLPYAATRTTLRPQYSDPARPNPRLVEPALDLGLDFRTAVGRGLTLTGALNPDFGQVESDQVIQNLQNFEPFFPEKRPFFLEGLDIFQPVGSAYGTNQQLFYSRRIGLDAPILGAAKLTGTLGPSVDVGFLDALVMGAGNVSLVPIGYGAPSTADLAPYEARPDRRWRFHPAQPFHLGPESGLPGAHPVTTNYLAAVARRHVGSAATAGVTFAASTPLEPRCRRSEFASDADFGAVDCTSHGSNALALDLDVPGDWGGFAQVDASQAVGGPAGGRVLRDGTVLRSGDLGWGGHFRAGKLGGEPWRWDVLYVFQGKKLDLNQTGFQPFSDFQWGDLDLHYVRPSGFGAFHNFHADWNLDLNWNEDFSLPRGVNSNVQVSLQLPSYQTVGLKVGLENPQYDSREIPEAGVGFQRMGDVIAALVFGSDPSKRLQASGDVFAFRTLGRGPFPARTGWGLDLTAFWRPHSRVETRLDVAYGLKPQGPRWVESVDGTAVFREEIPEFVSVTLRQGLVFTPRLSAQVYAQLFASAIRFRGGFWGAPLAGRRRLNISELQPVSYAGDPATHDAVGNVNAVLRWEYRLGSTLFLVYTRSQTELPVESGPAPSGLGPTRLFRGPLTESFLVKWSYWLER
jgi:hypothetical protein